MNDFFVTEDNTVVSLKAESVKRHWFLTINENAPCFDKVDNICFHLNDKGSMDRWYHFAYIKHDKDTVSMAYYEKLSDENKDNYKIVEEGKRTSACYAYKRPHYHVLLSFEDAKRWSKIKKAFEGAHVEVCQSVGSCFAYMTHDTPDCIRQGKHKYSRDEIVSDSPDYFTKVTYSTVVFDTFDPAMIMKYVFIEKMDMADILLRFGCPQTQRWLGSIKSAIETFKELAHSDEVIKHPPFYCVWDKSFGLHFVTEEEFDRQFNSNPYSVKLEKWAFSKFGYWVVRYLLEHEPLMVTDSMKYILITSEEYAPLVEKYQISFDLSLVDNNEDAKSVEVVNDIKSVFDGREIGSDEWVNGTPLTPFSNAVQRIDERVQQRNREYALKHFGA